MPPAGVELGPLRLELGEWRRMAPSPGEIATGHLIKLQGRIFVAGREALHWRQSRIDGRGLALWYRKGPRWHAVRRAGGWHGIRERYLWEKPRPGQKREINDFSLALPVNLVPTDAEEMRLSGRLHYVLAGKGPGRMQGRLRHLTSAPVRVTLWQRGQPWPAPRANPKSSLTASELAGMLYGVASPVAEAIGRDGKATAVLEWNIMSEFQPPRWDSSRRPFAIAPQDVQLLDDAGRDWLQWAPRRFMGEGAWLGNMGQTAEVEVYGQQLEPGKNPFRLKLTTEKVPRRAGQLRLKASLSRYDYRTRQEEWPLQLETVVRPRWTTKNPGDLKLETVRVLSQRVRGGIGGHKGNLRPYSHDVPCVEIVLLYTGTKPLVFHAQKPTDDGYDPAYADEPLVTRLPVGERANLVFPDAHLFGPLLDKRELIVRWSRPLVQRYGRPPGADSYHATHRPGGNSGTTHPKLERTADGTRVTIRHVLHGFKTKVPGLTFRTEIGLRDQGMLEIKVPLG